MSLSDISKKLGRGSQIICDWVGNDGRTVPRETAQDRADVCTGRISGSPCPHNVQENLIIGLMGESVRHLLEVKNKASLRVQGEKKLRGCDVCGCHLRLKVHVPMEHLLKFTPKDEIESHPEYCWMRTETKGKI